MNWRGNLLRFCEVAGLPILEPFVRLAAGEEKGEQFKGIAKFILLPIAAIGIFVVLWAGAAGTVVTDAAKLPSPGATWAAGKQLFAMHRAQKAADQQAKQEKLKQAVTYIAQAKAVEKAAAGASGEQAAKLKAKSLTLKKRAVVAANFKPSSAPTFVDQIFKSIQTVFFGFLLATLIAVPLGVLCGMSPWFNAALNPFIQVFKPVSPLAWLPLAFIVIMWYYSGAQPGETLFEKAFLISAATVCLCSLWPTLVNTTLGVASVDKDFINVADVLKLSWTQRLFKIILPASLPLMFAGMRISLGVGWMVLIAADMLAQNPGLGKFVWDEFQNGSELTYARIAFSVIIIGVIGLLLDRVMIFLRNLVSFGNPAPA
ncbi:MAG: ABC transporter permease subunit [Planctomycetota bacterium]